MDRLVKIHPLKVQPLWMNSIGGLDGLRVMMCQVQIMDGWVGEDSGSTAEYPSS